MEKKVNFQMDEVLPEWLEGYDEDKFTVFKACFLSSAKNSHNLDISPNVLKHDAKTILGNFLVAKLQYGDASTHLPSEIIYGYFPKEQEIEFEEVEDGIVKAWAYCVISKQYGQEFNEIFDLQNLRNTSVEMKVKVVDDADEGEVESFNIYGLTCLGLSVKGSCPDAMMTMIRFSQEDADAYFNKMNEHNLTPLKKFAKERIESMAEKDNYVNHPIDTSKEALHEGEWDGQKAKQDLVKEKNFKSLAPKVCMKLEEGWEDREVTKLGYPVMMLYDGKWVYSRQGLASALGYAKKENETTVVNKIEKIYKKLDLGDNEGGKEEKMAEIEFSAVNIGDLWGHVYHAIHEHDAWDYCIQGIYEEDNQKFAVLIDRDQKLYRLNFSLTEEGFGYDEELVEVKQEFTDTDNIKKFAEPENVEQYTKFADPKDEDDESDDKDDEGKDEPKEEPTKMSEDEMMAKIAELEKSVEERDHIIMDKDTELEELRAYKAAVVAKEMACRVDSVMEEVRTYINDEQFAEFKAEGLSCGENDIDAWSNKVKATCFSEVKKNIKKDDKGVFSFAMPKVIKHSDPNSIWEKLENK